MIAALGCEALKVRRCDRGGSPSWPSRSRRDGWALHAHRQSPTDGHRRQLERLLALIAQIAAVGGTLVFGMFTIWIFGREFSEHTVKDLLALPTSRTAIMSAKLIIATSWCLALTGYLFTLAPAVGTLLRLPDWSVDVAVDGFATLLMFTFALAASIGRGYGPRGARSARRRRRRRAPRSARRWPARSAGGRTRGGTSSTSG